MQQNILIVSLPLVPARQAPIPSLRNSAASSCFSLDKNAGHLLSLLLLVVYCISCVTLHGVDGALCAVLLGEDVLNTALPLLRSHPRALFEALSQQSSPPVSSFLPLSLILISNSPFLWSDHPLGVSTSEWSEKHSSSAVQLSSTTPLLELLTNPLLLQSWPLKLAHAGSLAVRAMCRRGS